MCKGRWLSAAKTVELFSAPMLQRDYEEETFLKRLIALLMALLLWLTPALGEELEVLVEDGVAVTEDLVVEYGYDYSSPEEVALYLYVFVELPPNFITKDEARELGWVSSEGNLWDVTDGMSIGGDIFGNREGLLPEEADRVWYECDVNYEGGFRGGERVVFSDDGLIYYTADHYESFELMYDGWYEGDLDMGDYADEYWADAA